jgi:hypothetical protein
MADDKVVDEKGADKGPQPGVDADAIRAAVRDELSAWQPPEPQRREPAPRPQPQGDPLANIIGAHVNPALQQMGYEIADAKDAALFYVDHPEMHAHKGEIEKAFNSLKAQGTPMTRSAVADWYRGKNFDKFVEERKDSEKKAAERARDAADTGGGSGRSRNAVPVDPHSQSDDDLAKSLEGVAF